ncbi:MAG: glycoside hydrolase family 31 protein [Bacteroidota bacterium]|nr:glycoside hydrolase family 31 protein [Bacteroidota bacterium]
MRLTDFDEWLWLDHAKFPSGLSGEQMRQVYGLLMQKISSEIYEQKNTRTYGLVRSSNAGGVSFPYVIYNDYYNHRDFITALINSSFIGVQWTPEVRSSKTAEEWVRRMQTACFSPMAMINAWADGTKPWTFTEVEDIVRDISFLRNQFLPYIYTCYANYYFKGIPPFMAMNLLNTFKSEDVVIRGALNATDNPYAKAINSEMKDQYMVGENLLVAPLFAGEKSRKVVLPIGNWYDFYTGEKVGNGEIIEVNAGLNKIPLFVKEGGIIPLTEKFLKTPQKGDKLNLEVRVYGKVPTEYFLYDDDGTTYDYQKGLYSLMRLWVEKDKEGNLKGHHKMVKGISNQYYNDISWKFMTK